HVIYVLNTKNDEHEASIQALKEAHQEEIQRILAETRETILQYECKVGEEQELRKHIKTLEDTLEQHKRLTEEALAEFTMCNKQVEERELGTEAKHAERIITLSKEMIDMKKDFENKLQHFYQESESLVNKCKPFRQEKLDKKEIIDEKCSVELHALINEMEILKKENQKITEEYPQKANKLQASYKKEKEPLKKAMQQSVADTQKQCQQRETKQKKSSETQEATLLWQMKKLEADLEVKGQNINELKKHSQKLKERLQDLEIQLKESQRETLESKNTMKNLEEELNSAKERLMLQENEILSKAGKMLINVIVNYFLLLVVHIVNSQVTYPIEATAIEIEDIKQQHKEELHKIKCQSAEEKMRLKEQLVKGLEDLVKKHSMEIKSAQTSMEAERKTLQKEFQVQLEELKKNSENEINQLEKEKEALKRKLQDSSFEVITVRLLKVAQLKQTLDQQANNLKDSLKEQILQSSKEKEKLLQPYIYLSCLQVAEEHLKKKYDDSIKIQHQSHRLEIQALEEKAKKALQVELEQIQKDQAALIETLRMELSEQHTSCTSHKKQMEELQLELKNVRALKKQQAKLNHFEYHFDRLLEEDFKVEHKKELNILKQDHRKEIQSMVSDFSSAQAHLQAKIVSLETELKELEEKQRKQESRPEDMHLIGCLQNKLSEREEIIKQLTEGRKFQHVLLPSTESHRNRSFSFNPNPRCLTPSMKQKKLNEVPSRVVSVPNLASYAKNLLSCDLRSKRSAPSIAKSTSLDQSAGCIRASYQSTQSSDMSHAARTQGNEAPKSKDDQKQDPRHQEWFTKYFSF
uniref:Family with sequence similarity 184 member B n=1 Tax=Pelusios castaneus TaxID=367368 RepID=A0A8C8RT56_9SAUR